MLRSKPQAINHAAYPNLAAAINTLRTGGIIAYPTEAVFGLGCDPLNQSAVDKILTIKKRPIHKGLLLISHDWSTLTPWIARDFWPNLASLTANKPTTWLVPKQGSVPTWISGEFSSIGVRIIQHPLIETLCKRYRKPIISTSANVSNQPECKTLLETRLRFKENIDHYVAGKVGEYSRPSQIIDAVSGRVLRG